MTSCKVGQGGRDAALQFGVINPRSVYMSSMLPTRNLKHALAGASCTSHALDAGALGALGRAASGSAAPLRLAGAGRRWGGAGWGWAPCLEQGQGTAVQLDGQRVLAQLGAVLRVRAGAVWGQGVGLLAALHAGGAVRLEGHRVGAHQLKRLAHALWQDLHAQLGAELRFDLRYGLLPALASGAEAGGCLGCWGGLVAEEFGDEFVEALAGSWGLCYTCH